MENVYDALTSHNYESALERHGALVRSLSLPQWSVGMGYSRIVDGTVPPEAGTPRRPPRLTDLWPLPEWIADINVSDPKEWFQQVCQQAFKFLEKDFGFRRDPARELADRERPSRLVVHRTDGTIQSWPQLRAERRGLKQGRFQGASESPKWRPRP